jgi:hypothetical protein
VELRKYPAPHLTGTTDLQELVHRMVFQHASRLELSEDGGQINLQFGDLLRWKNEETGAMGDELSLVVTPACDLTRNGVESILLLRGTLKPLAPSDWSYRTSPTRTAIIILPEDRQYWIKWDLKNVQTRPAVELGELLREGTRLKRIARLRETYAFEIQQKLLSDLGRLGPPANPPGTFPVSLMAFYVDTEAKARPLDTGVLESAVCYVGRDADAKPVHRLVLAEQTCDAILQAVAALNPNAIHPSARDNLNALRADQSFLTTFERGELDVPLVSGGPKPGKSAENRIYCYVFRNGDLADGHAIGGEHRNAPLLIRVDDIHEWRLQNIQRAY